MEYVYLKNGKIFNKVLSDTRPTDEIVYPAHWFEDFEKTYTQIDIIELAKKNLQKSVQKYLDNIAQVHGYDNIASACTYAGAVNPFQTEGQKFVTWRGNVWATCYSILGEILAGKRELPDDNELIALLPVF